MRPESVIRFARCEAQLTHCPWLRLSPHAIRIRSRSSLNAFTLQWAKPDRAAVRRESMARRATLANIMDGPLLVATHPSRSDSQSFLCGWIRNTGRRAAVLPYWPEASPVSRPPPRGATCHAKRKSPSGTQACATSGRGYTLDMRNAASASAAQAASTLRILVADDHELVRRGVCAVLETHPGWTICGEAAT